MKKLMILATFLLLGILSSCKEDESVICTTEYRQEMLSVKGDSLTDYFTVRLITNDTIRSDQAPYKIPTGEYQYIITTDSLRKELNGTIEPFLFIGKIGDATVVAEEYKIGANECHIFKESGKDRVEL